MAITSYQNGNLMISSNSKSEMVVSSSYQLYNHSMHCKHNCVLELTICNFIRIATYSLSSYCLQFIEHFSLLICREDIWQIARVKEHGDVLHEGLHFDLSIGEEEDSGLAGESCLQQQAFHVLPPVRRSIVACDLNTEVLVVGDVCSKAGSAVPSTATHT